MRISDWSSDVCSSDLHWLVRRLPDFARRHPGIAVELVIFTSRAQAEARSGDLDLRLLWMKPEDARSSSTQRLLFREQVFPVCAPSLLGGQTVLLGDPEIGRAHV